MIEARFENGAAIRMPDRTDLAGAVQGATDSLASCLPPDVRLDELVGVSIVRKVGACSLCGATLARAGQRIVTVLLATGGPVQLCGVCAAAVAGADEAPRRHELYPERRPADG